MSHEHTFQCPLPNGLHARPASLLVDVAKPFTADIALTNERTGVVANAKSVLDVIALDVKSGDRCRVAAAGRGAAHACAALREFIDNVLPICDEHLAAPAPGGSVELPRALRGVDIRWHAGTVACPGIGQGTVVIAGGLALPVELEKESVVSADLERENVHRATTATRAALEKQLSSHSTAEETGILRAHLSILDDIGFTGKVGDLITGGESAARAIVTAAHFFAARLRAAESAYVRERAVDVEDIALQLLEHVRGTRLELSDLRLIEPSVLVAENLTPRQLLALDKNFLEALVLEQAGATSHAVILARSFDVPTLTGVAEVRARFNAGQAAIVDANRGLVIPEPPVHARRYYEREQRTHARRLAQCARHAQVPAVTRDGRRFEVAANVATAEELAPAFAKGADGIGLFRTEMLFMDRAAAPSEEEQFAIYVQAVRAAGDRPVIIRTFDIGGDKPVPYLHMPRENNPFLGYRGVRIYPEHRTVFVAQLRAIARASAFGRVWLMIPMISSVDEILWVKARLSEIQSELDAAHVRYEADMPIGIMIEVPSAAFIIDQIATEVDFFSIGTNDLIQYFVAVDRESDKVAGLYSARHPAFLRLLAQIVADVHRHGRWVGMCGEMTRSPRNWPLLVGLGLDEISTAAPEIPALKAAIAQWSAADCRALLDTATACRSITAVEDAVAAFRGRGAEADLFDLEFVHVGSDSLTKEEAIKELVDAFFIAGRTEDPRRIEDLVWAREAVYSTGLGHGFAIPHCKSDAISASSIGVLRLAQPIEWGAVDDQPVICVILLAVRESDAGDAHMKVFSKLARKLMHDEFRERLLNAADRADVLTCLADELGLST